MEMLALISFGWEEIGMVAIIGFVAGVLGGMLGVGGSVIMIPAMAILFDDNEQHIYQGAAMIANLAVSIPAAKRHHKAGAIEWKAVKLMLPAAFCAIFFGVWLSSRGIFHDEFGKENLQRIFGLFLIYVIAVNIRRLIKDRKDTPARAPNVTPVRATAIGAIMGTLAGFLGIGGGAIAVPLQQMLLKLPLKRCIANSATIICVTAGFGACYKQYLLSQSSDHYDSLALAAALCPTCVIGGYLGGTLTHRMPIKFIRLAFVIMLVFASWKMTNILSLIEQVRQSNP